MVRKKVIDQGNASVWSSRAVSPRRPLLRLSHAKYDFCLKALLAVYRSRKLAHEEDCLESRSLLSVGHPSGIGRRRHLAGPSRINFALGSRKKDGLKGPSLYDHARFTRIPEMRGYRASLCAEPAHSTISKLNLTLVPVFSS